ncbi:MAG: hypothetical protein ACI39F_08910 [Acutalibacteraceae bacterium]
MNYNKDICAKVFLEHENAQNYKSSIGKKGLYEQSKQNRRFYSGDQWYGAKVGANRPLVRHNIIKRIGEYKTAVIGGDEISVKFSPVGISEIALKDALNDLKKEIQSGKKQSFGKLSDSEIILAAKAVSEYFGICAKRLHFEDVCANALKNAYITGSGIVYAYWDGDIKTGLFADDERKTPIMGDICAEVIDIENVDFSDPTVESVQKQDYIIIASRKTVGELIREAKRNGASALEIESIKPDNEYCSGEAFYSEKATVLTKFFKSYDSSGNYTINAVKVCKNAVIKPQWDTGLKLYPIAKFNWEQNNLAYGESEITNLIPNQIAINRMLTASVWAVMMMGMPIMVVNGDVVTEPVTNDPGQIISFCGNSDDFDKAVKYVAPPEFSQNFESITSKLIENTLNASGATDAALGTLQAQNTSAIESVKESARLPLTLFKKRYITFIEDIAMIFLDFMLNMYGTRPLMQKSGDDIWYFPFSSQRYADISFICEATLSGNDSDIKTVADELDSLNKSDKKELADYLLNNKGDEKV